MRVCERYRITPSQFSELSDTDQIEMLAYDQYKQERYRDVQKLLIDAEKQSPEVYSLIQIAILNG